MATRNKTPEFTPTQNAEPEDFIVQHIHSGYHNINDLALATPLTFGPHEVKDLTYEDGARLKKSPGLTKSLIEGILVRITRDQANHIMLDEIQHRRAEENKQSN